MQYFLRNWKTTLAGFIVLLITLLVQNNIITPEQSSAIIGAFTAFGFINASDAKEKIN